MVSMAMKRFLKSSTGFMVDLNLKKQLHSPETSSFVGFYCRRWLTGSSKTTDNVQRRKPDEFWKRVDDSVRRHILPSMKSNDYAKTTGMTQADIAL